MQPPRAPRLPRHAKGLRVDPAGGLHEAGHLGRHARGEVLQLQALEGVEEALLGSADAMAARTFEVAGPAREDHPS